MESPQTKTEIKEKCIKAICPNYDVKYASEDLDAYYCATCLIEKTAVARHIDKQLATRGPKRVIKSDLQIYDETVRVTGNKFPRA